MNFKFADTDIKKISDILSCPPKQFGSGWSWQMKNTETGQGLVFSIYNEVGLGGGKTGVLVSVQTQHGYFELHDCNGYLIFEPDEVIFLSATGDKVSSMSIGRSATCSLYSNISRDILNADFAALDPAVLLSAMQLSITESVLPVE